MEQNENTLSVLKIAPGQYPQQVEIDNDLKALQQAVGGSIGASYPFEDAFTIFRLARTAGVSLPGKTKYLQQVYTIYNGGSRRAALPLKF